MELGDSADLICRNTHPSVTNLTRLLAILGAGGFMITIGNYEVRTHWSEMRQEVKACEQYTILHEGPPIAQLIPPEITDRPTRSKRAADNLLQLIATRAPVAVEIKALFEDGRD